MFIKEVQVNNFRLFAANCPAFCVKLRVPDAQNEGSGLTAFVGENGCGKTTLLDAIALTIVPFKAESFALDDFHDPLCLLEKVVSPQRRRHRHQPHRADAVRSMPRLASRIAVLIDYDSIAQFSSQRRGRIESRLVHVDPHFRSAVVRCADASPQVFK